MTKKLIILRYKELFSILEEIKEKFEFKLEFYDCLLYTSDAADD